MRIRDTMVRQRAREQKSKRAREQERMREREKENKKRERKRPARAREEEREREREQQEKENESKREGEHEREIQFREILSQRISFSRKEIQKYFLRNCFRSFSTLVVWLDLMLDGERVGLDAATLNKQIAIFDTGASL